MRSRGAPPNTWSLGGDWNRHDGVELARTSASNGTLSLQRPDDHRFELYGFVTWAYDTGDTLAFTIAADVPERLPMVTVEVNDEHRRERVRAACSEEVEGEGTVNGTKHTVRVVSERSACHIEVTAKTASTGSRVDWQGFWGPPQQIHFTSRITTAEP